MPEPDSPKVRDPIAPLSVFFSLQCLQPRVTTSSRSMAAPAFIAAVNAKCTATVVHSISENHASSDQYPKLSHFLVLKFSRYSRLPYLFNYERGLKHQICFHCFFYKRRCNHAIQLENKCRALKRKLPISITTLKLSGFTFWVKELLLNNCL